MPYVLEIDIAAPLRPLERGELYELPLCDIFDELDDGDIIGGSTHVASGAIQRCQVQFETSDVDRLMPRLLQLLIDSRAPAGTVLRQLEPKLVELHAVQ
jgi:hypothetical protein